VSALSDHSGDTFTTVKNLSVLVSALQDSTTLIRALNTNLASVTGLLADDPNAIANAVKDLDDVAGKVKTFIADNRDTVSTTSQKLSSVTTTLTQSLDDIKQDLHVLPNVAANFQNIYQPAQGTLSGALAVNNFADPITFLCGAIQAASRLNNEQSAKLCVQYLAPIVKNRQMNFPPLGLNPFVGASARPNELTYSEDRLRPDYAPPQPNPPQPHGSDVPGQPLTADALAAEAPSPAATAVEQTDPNAGLRGIMVPAGAGR
jgi:phospholipid/cholesterol/gamma-HCH transport system substrate-binding protein